MPVLTQDQYNNYLKTLTSKIPDGGLVDDVADALGALQSHYTDSLNQSIAQDSEWEQKYNTLAQNYRDRFFTPAPNQTSAPEPTLAPESAPADEPELTFADLFS